MSDDADVTPTLSEGERLLSDPELLKGMRLARDVKNPGSDAILVPAFTPITVELVERLGKRGIETVFAETIQEKTVAATAEHVDQMFNLIDDIVQEALGSLDNVGEQFQMKQNMKDLERLVRDNLEDIDQLFSAKGAEKLAGLTQHHNGTARHSLMSGFILMAIGRELGWSDDKIVKAALAALHHDVGKTKVKLETLDWPGRLSAKQWKEIQLHPLLGAILLYRRGEKPGLPMLTALLHHEWFAEVEGKGYGGLTLHRDYIKKNLKLDIPAAAAELDPDDLDIIQASALADMISALEESRAYKRQLDSFKVLVIMNSDAKLGHFNPAHFAAWRASYLRQYPKLLPQGLRVALPREKERRIFKPLKAKAIPPTPLLTHSDLEKLGYLPILANVGMDMERIRRRGGLAVKVLEQICKDKRIDLDLSKTAFQKAGVNPIKNQVIPERQVIELDARRYWLSVEDLEKSGLLGQARSLAFDIKLIRQQGGIRPERLEKRGVSISAKKLERLGIERVKEWTVTLPGNENRLTAEDIQKLGISDARLKAAGLLERVRAVKSGVPMAWLEKAGLRFAPADLAKAGIDPVRKIFYDIQVAEEVGETRACFYILREGDDLAEIESANEEGRLNSIQDLLFNQVGMVELDFADLLALPDLSHVTQGGHWNQA